MKKPTTKKRTKATKTVKLKSGELATPAVIKLGETDTGEVVNSTMESVPAVPSDIPAGKLPHVYNPENLIVAMPICHKDCAQAVRLLRFMAELHPLKDFHFLAYFSINVPPQYKNLIKETAQKAFTKVSYVEQEREEMDERGWPKSPSTMFSQLITLVVRKEDKDLFLIEPDICPVKKDWIEIIYKLHCEAGNTFTGAFVPKGPFYKSHMTGNGIYGRNSIFACPKLFSYGPTQPNPAWDVDCGTEILEDFTDATHLIKHVWRDEKADYDRYVSTSDICLFHQCKTGHFIKQAIVKLGLKPSYDILTIDSGACYFKNVSPAITYTFKKTSFRFNLVPAVPLMRGIFTTEDDDLSAFLRSQSTVTEISKEEYDKLKQVGAKNSGFKHAIRRV